MSKQFNPLFETTYLETINKINNVQQSFTPILLKFVKSAKYDGTGLVIFINRAFKEEVAAECGVSVWRIEGAITTFVHSGYIERMAVGKYRLSAQYFGTEEWKNIVDIKFTYDCTYNDINVEIKRDKKLELLGL